jgi:hypothetical protein
MGKCFEVCCGQKMRKRWSVASVLVAGFHILLVLPFGWPLLNLFTPFLAMREYCLIMEGILT